MGDSGAPSSFDTLRMRVTESAVEILILSLSKDEDFGPSCGRGVLCYWGPMGKIAGVISLSLAVTLSASAAGAAPHPAPARSFVTPYRTDSVDLPLAAGGSESEGVYFVRMKAGEVLVYSWSIEGGGAPADFYAELSGTVASKAPHEPRIYRKGTGASAEGAFTAPFSWLFKNDSDQPATVKLTLAGFYAQPSVREAMGLDGPAYIPFGPPRLARPLRTGAEAVGAPADALGRSMPRGCQTHTGRAKGSLAAGLAALAA